MRFRNSVVCFVHVVFAILVMSVTQLSASVILPNLPAGSKYQLVFVTAGTRDATSSNIADYNTFVTQEAALGSSLPTGVTWTAIGSTTTVDAMHNALTYDATPIYNTHGQLVASGKTDLWDGSVQNRIDYDQYGNHASSSNQFPWTGTLGNGHAVSTNELGTTYINPFTGHMESCYGWTDVWTTGNGYWTKYDYAATSYKSSFYALSSPLSTVPEPCTLAVWSLLGAVGMTTTWLRRRKTV